MCTCTTELYLYIAAACQAPALAWDEKLAASAKAWAATCQFAVSRTPGVGEGLGFGYSSLPEAVQDWYAQVRRVQRLLQFFC